MRFSRWRDSLAGRRVLHDPKQDRASPLHVRLKPTGSTAYPRAANYTNVGLAQGIAYLDFGFIEPGLLAAIAKTAKEGQAVPKGLDGHLVTRVAMDVGALMRLQQLIQQVLVRLRDARKPKAKG